MKHCLLFLIFFCALLTSCWNDDDSTSQTSTFETTLSILDQNENNIEVEQQGIPITLSFSFHNVSGRIQTLRFPGGQQYDLQVYDSQDNLVWNWANDKNFIQVQTELVFDIDETKTYEETWNQTSNDDTQVPAGIYHVYVNREWDTDRSTGPELIDIE